MRLLRALTHLVLALAFVSVATAQARTGVCAPMEAASRQHHGHEAPAVAVEHAAHDHGSSGNERSAPERDDCQTACCFTAGRMAAPAPAGVTIGFFCAVRYVVDAQPVSSRAFAPDPGVPKPLA